MKTQRILALWLLPFFGLVLLFQILPLLRIVADSFYNQTGALTFENYLKIFTNPFYLMSLQNSIFLSFYSSVFGIGIALGGAYAITKLPVKIRDRVLMFSNMIANFAGVPLGFAFMVLLGYNGLFTILLKSLGLDLTKVFSLYSGVGLIVVYTYFQVPLGILLLYPAFDGLRLEWKEAARNLGASDFAFWRHIGIPILLPSLLGTFSILFANSMGAYATAYALTSGNYNLVTVRIGALISGNMFLDPNLASALAVILGLTLLLLTQINDWMLKRRTEQR